MVWGIGYVDYHGELEHRNVQKMVDGEAGRLRHAIHQPGYEDGNAAGNTDHPNHL